MTVARFLLVMLLALPVAAIEGAGADASFSGRVIFFDTDRVEVKKGPVEHVFQLTGDTVVSSAKNGPGINALALCQKVRVTYRAGEKEKVAVKIEIIRAGDCVKHGK